MPLLQSGSPDAIHDNIRELIRDGHPTRSAVAAALHIADQYGKRRAAGGSTGATPGGALAGAINTPFAPGGILAPQAGTPAPVIPAAPTAPTYQTGTSMAPLLPNNGGYGAGILPNGLMNTPSNGGYTFDASFGGLSPSTVAALTSFSQRGLPTTATPTSVAPAATPIPDPSAQQVADIFSQANQSAANDAVSSARGGRLRRRADGGITPPIASMASSMAKSGFRSIDHPAGLVHGIGAGRTDTVPMNVAAGSHVIPSDVIAGIGQDNTLSGAHAMGMAMKTGPGGITLPSGPHRGMSAPKMPSYSAMQGLSSPHLARGGDPQFEGHAIKIARGGAADGVKCIVANGEWIMKPDEVERTSYKGKNGHEAIDSWIMDRRREHTKKLRELRPPVGMKR